MIKKIIMIGISTLMAFTLGACGNGEPSAEGNTGVESSLENVTESISEAPDGESSESNNENTNIDSESMVLIAYFSWSGNTKQLAEMIQEQTGGELFEIEPETPYTDDINELSGISLQEQHDNIRPALSSAAPDMSQYDVIFVGYANRGYGARKPHQVSRSGSKSTKWVLSYAGETCSSRIKSPPIIKADLRERMLPHGKENFEKK